MRRFLTGKTIDEVAIERIRAYAPNDGKPLWVADSGGKDSTVIVDLVKRSGVPAEYHYSPTTVDPPEVVRFLRKHHPETVFERPKMSMWQAIRENKILPTRHRRFCCRLFKEGGGTGHIVTTGVRWEESTKRAGRQMFSRCDRYGKWQFNPIIDWLESDVWDYIRERELPYCSLYDEGFHRVGCVCCPLQTSYGMARDIARWPNIAARWRKACDYVYTCNDRAEKHESADALWHWWTHGQPGLEKDERTLFDD